MANIPDRPEYQSELFKQGLEVRRDVLGGDYVDASLARADDFNAAFQQMTTEVAWGMMLDASRPAAQDAQHDQPDDAVGTQPRRGVPPAPARRADQRRDARRDQGDPAADRRLLRHSRLPGGVQASPPKCSRKSTARKGSD